MLFLQDYVLVVPEGRYSSSFLNEEPLDRSYDFISSCGQNSFSIRLVVKSRGSVLVVPSWNDNFCLSCSSSSSSTFCLMSAVSLSAFFNNGALPCGCHEVGADSNTCQPFGGQCSCRPNVIGRDCTMCATGYWGFPDCKRESLCIQYSSLLSCDLIWIKSVKSSLALWCLSEAQLKHTPKMVIFTCLWGLWVLW